MVYPIVAWNTTDPELRYDEKRDCLQAGAYSIDIVLAVCAVAAGILCACIPGVGAAVIAGLVIGGLIYSVASLAIGSYIRWKKSKADPGNTQQQVPQNPQITNNNDNDGSGRQQPLHWKEGKTSTVTG